MYICSLLGAVILIGSCYGLPLNDGPLFDTGEDDTALVESLVREVRAAQQNPEPVAAEPDPGTRAYIHTYTDGADGENEQGYYRRKSDKGNDGYKHFDSFHKKNADKYAFEAHSAFGKYAGQDHTGTGRSHHKRSAPVEGPERKLNKANKVVAVQPEEVDAEYVGEGGGEYYSEGSEGNDGDHAGFVGEASDVDIESEANDSRLDEDGDNF
ncbi:uncharacterized protein LOC108737874 [Agrilus planipennis]|uniref:Uncharacterized protein LOC108737874 n=1 Tax=Agrilus planipennis TaxID=224129 RepID=A0A1W4X283_AGRPL|nr:uncharacterized protein LOC108737874 [Agrilus planipennis]